MEREVVEAKSAGFCFGVERAVDQVYEQIEAVKNKKASGPIYTYGPIIHNEEVVRDLSDKGVMVLETEEELRALPRNQGTVIIRSHGVSRHVYEILKERNVAVVDATCPFVLKIHNIVQKESEAGKNIIIIGNGNHPEVEGIKGWCSTEAFVLESEKEAENFSYNGEKKLCVVSQTTFNYKKFNNLVEILEKKGYDIHVLNTICNATEERQTEARRIAKEVDAMIVIGGRQSSNTQKLFEICKQECENTYYIQTLDDLDVHSLQSVSCVGITAGASTPNNIIEEVQNNV